MGCTMPTEESLRDSKTLRRPPAYGRPASLREHERLVQWIVSWAYLIAEGLEEYRR